MKITGFTFVKNALIYDYPIIEAINSVLPICDEFVVAVGKSDDDSLGLIKSIQSNKIRVLETEWNEDLRDGGRVLAEETDKAFAAISDDTDWAFYIQGDEVIHEKYLAEAKMAMEKYLDNKEVDGFLFNYAHFYGSYDYVGASASWYSHEIRIIRNNKSIFSYKDAQGFRKGDNEKLKVVPLEGYIYHYGWVKQPEAMQRKQQNFNKYWHDDQWIEENVQKGDKYNYEEHLRELKRFDGEHPEVMKKRIEEKNWKFDYDISHSSRKLKDKVKDLLKKIGIDTSYRNYILLKK